MIMSSQKGNYKWYRKLSKSWKKKNLFDNPLNEDNH